VHARADQAVRIGYESHDMRFRVRHTCFYILPVS
jgi:hypothetical protein